MNYGDFSSLVQLGVGLHVGTALLQLYGEIGVQPLIRTITRIKALVDDKNPDLVEELAQVESDFEIFRIRLFNEYKFHVRINFLTSLLLILLLIFVAYNAQTPIGAELSVFVVFISVVPALATLGILWADASKAMRPLKTAANALEQKVLKRPR